MGGINGYEYVDNSMRWWEDTHKGVRRLVIDIHGAEDGVGNAVGKVMTSEGLLKADEFVTYLNKLRIKLDDYGKIKLHSCYSASAYDTFGSSFARDLAYITKKEVKGYEGPMYQARMLGEKFGTPNSIFVKDPEVDRLLGSDLDKAKVAQSWAPRKIDWARDINGLPMFDSNGVAIPKQFSDFRPKTFRPGPGPYQIEEIPGDHCYEKLIKRFTKNPDIYSDPYAEINYHLGSMQSARKDPTLLNSLLEGDSLC